MQVFKFLNMPHIVLHDELPVGDAKFSEVDLTSDAKISVSERKQVRNVE